jgi:hypothetical protein
MEKKIVSEARDDAERRAGRFHPLVYKTLAGLAVWFVVSSWLFAGHGRTDYLLAVASGVVLAFTGLAALLGMTRREAREKRAFGDWASHDVQIGSGPVKGTIAAIEAIVPIAAVAFGMTIFGLVLHFAR